MSKGKVVVGMSGGVDSSVAAYLLKEQGYEVIGMFMKNWEEDEECPAAEDYEDALQVCNHLGIPCYSVSFSEEYWNEVFAPCLEQYAAGHTPNPDILCNREIKFSRFFQKAMELGADYLATGHYCRNLLRDGRHYLGRGVDVTKDQSYFLYTMQEEVLKKVLFPVGELEKTKVREIAESQGLVTAAKKDSTGICFVGKRNFKSFLSNYIAPKKGDFKTPEGEVVGTHDGISYYTIGQRKGLGIGGPGEAWFVVDKDVENNEVIVVQGEKHPALYRTKAWAVDASWVNEAPQTFPFQCTAKLRYRQVDIACTITQMRDGELTLEFDEPQKAVTAYQAVVFYQDEVCLGGASLRLFETRIWLHSGFKKSAV